MTLGEHVMNMPEYSTLNTDVRAHLRWKVFLYKNKTRRVLSTPLWEMIAGWGLRRKWEILTQLSGNRRANSCMRALVQIHWYIPLVCPLPHQVQCVLQVCNIGASLEDLNVICLIFFQNIIWGQSSRKTQFTITGQLHCCAIIGCLNTHTLSFGYHIINKHDLVC